MIIVNVLNNTVWTFIYYYRQVIGGETGQIPERDIRPVDPDRIEKFENLDDCDGIGLASLERTVIIRLNGGLGTSMGLIAPKSLIEIKNGESCLYIIIRQAEKNAAKLAFMNSCQTFTYR